MSQEQPAAPPTVEHPAAAAALAALDTAMEELAAVEPWRVGEGDLLAVLGRLSTMTSRAQGVRLDWVAEAEHRDAAASVGATSLVAWLRVATRQRAGFASRDVRLATALRARYATTRAALCDGRVDVDRAEVIRDCIDRLPAAVDAETRERAEAELLEHAEEYDATVLARIGRHLHTVLDPDGPEEVERAETNAVDFRELFLTPLDNGTVRLRGMLDAEGGAALQAALGPLAAPRPTTAEGTDRRTPATRRADALLELVAQAVAAGPPASSGAAAPTLTVTVSYEQLRDQLCGVLVDTETLVSPTTVRRLACDAGIVPAVLDAESQPLDIGRRSRTIPPAIRRAVELRDQHCVFPGCDRPPGFCQCHHIVHWADGGDTSVGNLALLCGHHHRLIHSRAGWTITATPGRSPTVHSPPWALAA